MDYEKKYNDALKRAKELLLGNEQSNTIRSYFEHIFLELRENEDERMRKAALAGIEYLEREIGWDAIDDIDILDVKDYLEKQKELMPPINVDPCDASWDAYYQRGLNKGYELGLETGRKEQKPNIEICPHSIKSKSYKEQKPAWSEEDEEALDMCLDAIPKKWKTKSGILLTKWLKDNIYPQPKQEWSEEDERIYNIIIEILEKTEHNGHLLHTDLIECVKLLKSLRPQPQGVYKQIIHSIYKMLKGKDFYGMPTSNCISLLNDIRVKCKDADECAEILDEPSWKPSEEQMEALKEALETYKGFEEYDAMKSLYNDLKKL